MKKFWNLMLAALVIIGATACTENYEGVDKVQEAGFSFYAEVVNDGTRAYIDNEDGDKTWNTVWEQGDKLIVKVAEAEHGGGGAFEVEFECKDAAKGQFVSYEDDAANLQGQNVTITTAGTHHSLEGKNAFYTNTVVNGFDNTKPIYLEAHTSFFRFTFNGTGNVKLALSENKFRNDDKSETNEITLKGASGDIFLAFWPGEELKSSLALTINGKAIKAADDLTFKQGKVYNLGTFDFPYEVSTYSVPGSQNNWTPGATPMYVVDDYYVAYGVEFADTSNEFKILGDDGKWLGATSFTLGAWTNLVVDAANIAISAGSYDIYFSKSRTMVCVVETGAEVPAMPASTIGLVGSFQGWDEANPVAMTYSVDSWVVAENVELYRDDAFKFIDGKSWDVNYGAADSGMRAELDKEYTLNSNGQDIRVTTNGKFNIYFNTATRAFKYECVEEYNIAVTVTINNTPKWNPLNVTIVYNGAKIVDNETVSGNAYPLDGKYIGESLEFTFSSGDNTSTTEYVSISRSGATVDVTPKVETPTYDLYLKPNSNWVQSNAWFAAYIWGTNKNAKWVKMTDDDKDGTYELVLPSGYGKGDNIIFCRMNPSSTALDWGSKWDQTKDLKIPSDGKNLFTVANNAWNNASGTWSQK